MSAKTNDRIKAELVRQEQGPSEDNLNRSLEVLRPQIDRALPKGMDADRFARIVVTTVKASPKLAGCTKSSVIAGCMLAAQLGLEPGPLGHSYLVPYFNKSISQDEAQFQIGYKGAIDLARRSGLLKDIQARTVFEGDLFEEEQGTNERLIHVPARTGQRRPPHLYYLYVRFTNGGTYQRVAERWEVEEHRQRSKAANVGPWKSDYEAMAWKTLVHMSKPWLPLTAEAAAGMALDGAVVNDLAANMVDEEAARRQDVIDIEAEDETSQPVPSDEPPANDPGRPFDE